MLTQVGEYCEFEKQRGKKGDLVAVTSFLTTRWPWDHISGYAGDRALPSLPTGELTEPCKCWVPRTLFSKARLWSQKQSSWCAGLQFSTHGKQIFTWSLWSYSSERLLSASPQAVAVVVTLHWPVEAWGSLSVQRWQSWRSCSSCSISRALGRKPQLESLSCGCTDRNVSWTVSSLWL